MNEAARHARASIAAITRHRGDDDPRIPQLQTDLSAARLEEHIRRVVNSAPPLTPEQREKLAFLLHPGERGESRARAS